MLERLRFRDRISLLVTVAAIALLTVTAVTLTLGRLNEEQLTGIETRYVPLIELDRDLQRLFDLIPRALEDAASAAEEAKLDEADALVAELTARLQRDASTIIANGGDPTVLASELRIYYQTARAVSVALIAATPVAQLRGQIEAMLRAQQTFAQHLDTATSPDRRRLEAAFATARESHRTSLKIDVAVACIALALMTWLSWWITRRTLRSLSDVSVGVERLARGEFDHEIPVTSEDELGELAREANRTAARLREFHERAEREDWIKTGQAELAMQVAGDLEVEALAGRVAEHLGTYCRARAVAVFVIDASGAPMRIEVSSIAGLDAMPEVAWPTERDVRIVTGTEPVIIVPLLFDERSVGVLALAVASAPAEPTLDLLRRIQRVVGVALRVAQSHERTRSLLLETQRQASAAEAANKELEAFSFSVSHDLRAPLRAIDGFSQSLLEDFSAELPAKGQDYLRRIRGGAQRMAELIEDLLQLSRVSRGEFHRSAVNVSSIATAIIGELTRAEPTRTVEVHVADGVTAQGDARLIRIVLENLLSNAWKFTAKTAAPVIELGSRNDDGETVLFVRDNGAGFDMKHSDRLFAPFHRLHAEKDFAGTGIGLATVQRIVHRHGGRIWVEADVGKGATFFFTLPTLAV